MINLLEKPVNHVTLGLSFKAIIFFAVLATYSVFEKVVGLLEAYTTEIIPHFTYLDLGLVITGIIGAVVWIIKSRKVEKTETNFIRTEYRDKYQNDLNELFQLIIDNVKNTFTKTYYESIMTLPFKEKRLVLQHLFTDEQRFHPHYKLYSTYRKFIGSENAIEDDKVVLIDSIFELKNFLFKTGIKYKKSKTWFKPEKIVDILQIPKDVLQMEIAHYSYPNFYEKIPYSIPIERHMETKNEILFKVKENIFGGTISNTHSYKIIDKLQPRFTKITKMAWDIRVARNTMDDAFSQMYSGLFETALEPMKRGKPIVGVCESCIEYFNPIEKQKLQKLLDKFNKNWDGVSERQWRNKKSFQKLFSQIFTKNNSNSFRDSIQ